MPETLSPKELRRICEHYVKTISLGYPVFDVDKAEEELAVEASTALPAALDRIDELEGD